MLPPSVFSAIASTGTSETYERAVHPFSGKTKGAEPDRRKHAEASARLARRKGKSAQGPVRCPPWKLASRGSVSSAGGPGARGAACWRPSRGHSELSPGVSRRNKYLRIIRNYVRDERIQAAQERHLNAHWMPPGQPARELSGHRGFPGSADSGILPSGDFRYKYVLARAPCCPDSASWT